LDELGVAPGEEFYVLTRAELPETAHARRDGIDTSGEAARSLTPDTLRKSQEAVLACLQLGPCTDEHLIERYEQHRLVNGWPQQSASGLLSRRSELVNAVPPLVRDTGRREKLRSGRRSAVWEATVLAGDQTALFAASTARYRSDAA